MRYQAATKPRGAHTHAAGHHWSVQEDEQPDSEASPKDKVTPAPPVVSSPLKQQPTWTYFLTPAAVVIGSLIIAGAVWWTRDDSTEVAAAHDFAVAGGVSTAEATAPVAAATGLKDALLGYARQLGLNEPQFDQCLGSQQNVTTINQQLQAGNALGVTGTPTFFINNKKLVGAQPLAILEEIIQAELKGSPTTLDGYSAAVQKLAATTPPGFAIVPKKPDITGAAIEGSANAKVMVAEFSDFQCPFCKQWTESSIRGLRAKLGNDVALAFLHFPIVQIHPNAGNAAVVAICAQQQGKFWQMHDLLFAKQTEWSSLK